MPTPPATLRPLPVDVPDSTYRALHALATPLGLTPEQLVHALLVHVALGFPPAPPGPGRGVAFAA